MPAAERQQQVHVSLAYAVSWMLTNQSQPQPVALFSLKMACCTWHLVPCPVRIQFPLASA